MNNTPHPHRSIDGIRRPTRPLSPLSHPAPASQAANHPRPHAAPGAASPATRHAPVAEPLAHLPKLPPKRPLSPHAARPLPVPPATKPTLTTQHAPATHPSPPTARTPHHPLARAWSLAQYPLCATLAIASAYSSLLGQSAIALYAVYAVVRKLDSRISFGLALGMLCCIPLFQVIGLPGVSERAAVYTYELLVAGTLQAIWESIRHRPRTSGAAR